METCQKEANFSSNCSKHTELGDATRSLFLCEAACLKKEAISMQVLRPAPEGRIRDVTRF